MLVIGIAILLTGVLFDLYFVGIPYQDPPQEILAKYNRDAKIADSIMNIGIIVIIIGILAKAFIRKNDKKAENI